MLHLLTLIFVSLELLQTAKSTSPESQVSRNKKEIGRT